MSTIYKSIGLTVLAISGMCKVGNGVYTFIPGRRDAALRRWRPRRLMSVQTTGGERPLGPIGAAGVLKQGFLLNL